MNLLPIDFINRFIIYRFSM